MSTTTTASRDGSIRTMRTRTASATLAASILFAACAGASTTSSPAITSETPGAPPTTPAATPTPTASADPVGTAVVGAFLAMTQAPDRSVHLAASGTVRFAGQEMRLTSAYDLHGNDYRGTTTVESAAFGAMTMEVAGVNGQAFVNSGHGWVGSATATPAQDPFRGLVGDDVAYAGSIDLDGSPGHRLLLRDPAAAFTRAMSVTNPDGVGSLTVQDASFEVRVDDQGRPASASVSIRGTAAAAGDLEAAIDYTFTNWGSVAEIKAPVEIPSTPDPGAVLTVYNRITADIMVRDGNGVELPVPACGQASATTFDVHRFDVRLAANGDIVAMEFPREDSFVTRVAIVGADFFQTQPGALLEPLPPCRDYVPR